VILQNRAADGQSHPHSSGLGGVKGLEDSFVFSRIQAYPCVLHLDVDRRRSVGSGADDEFPRAVFHGRHGFGSIQDKIEQDLLKLDRIAQNRRKTISQLAPHDNSLPFCLVLHQEHDVIDDGVQVQLGLFTIGLLEEIAQPGDHITGSLAVPDNSLGGLAGFGEIFRIAFVRQPADAGIPVDDNPGERLIDLVGDGSRQLAHGGGAADAR
jgi:hypothetical protein